VGPRELRLKRSLLAAIIYHRMLELGLDPDDASDLHKIDLVVGMPSGRQSLQAALANYFKARAIDGNRPNTKESTFTRDVALLMARIEVPNAVFEKRASETAMQVIGRLLRYEAWNTKSGQHENWRNAVAGVASITPEPQRAERYHQLFQRHWEFNSVPCEDVFDDEERWFRILGLPPE
jgi:hypothetical protein